MIRKPLEKANSEIKTAEMSGEVVRVESTSGIVADHMHKPEIEPGLWVRMFAGCDTSKIIDRSAIREMALRELREGGEVLVIPEESSLFNAGGGDE